MQRRNSYRDIPVNMQIELIQLKEDFDEIDCIALMQSEGLLYLSLLSYWQIIFSTYDTKCKKRHCCYLVGFFIKLCKRKETIVII